MFNDQSKHVTKEEVEKCLPLLKKHIDIINPKVILILGSTALNALFSDLKTIANLQEKSNDSTIISPAKKEE